MHSGMEVSELELDTLAKELSADSGGFRVIADAVPNFIWRAEADGTVTYFNSSMLAYAGGLDEPRPQMRALLHPIDSAAVLERWDAAVASGEPFEAEFRFRRAADGTYRWFRARALPVRDDRGEVAWWIGAATDIDAQKRGSENLDFVIKASDMFTSAADAHEVCERFA